MIIAHNYHIKLFILQMNEQSKEKKIKREKNRFQLERIFWPIK